MRKSGTHREDATQPGAADDDALHVDHKAVGAKLRQSRKSRDLTLAQLSERSGIAVSTISKAERGDIALTYDKFAALAHALGVDFDTIFGRAAGRAPGPIAPTMTRSGKQLIYDTPNYEYGMIANDLLGKRMVPMRARIRARSLDAFPEYIRHSGEEFVFVLQGKLALHFENGAVFTLDRGDSLYFDSAQGHVYLSTGAKDAEVIVCCVDTDVLRAPQTL